MQPLNIKNIKSLRSKIAYILFEVFENKKSLNIIKSQDIDFKDRAYIQEVCFGVCRYLSFLENKLNSLLDKKIKTKNIVIKYILLASLYEIIFLNTKDYAILSETINSLKELKLDPFSGFVNAILRKVQSLNINPISLNDISDLKRNAYLHPIWLIKELKANYKDNWESILVENNKIPPLWLRVQKDYLSEFLNKLDTQGIDYLKTESSVKLLNPPKDLLGVLGNKASVQDLNAQRAARILDVENQALDILDACSAPGSKTTHILELSKYSKLVSADLSSKRLLKVYENLERLEFSDLNIEVLEADLTQDFNGAYDRILLDAPCSALGVIRRHPDIKWLQTQKGVENIVRVQKDILNNLWKNLKKGGFLLYATCSVLKVENESQIDAFLKENLDAKLCDIDDALIKSFLKDKDGNILLDNSKFYLKLRNGVQFFPSQYFGDGFYYSKLQKI